MRRHKRIFARLISAALALLIASPVIAPVAGAADEGEYAVYDNCKYLASGDNPYATLVGVVNERATTCEIHPDTEAIGAYAFCDCIKLTAVTIPESVVSIGDGAFSNCPRLTEIIVPSGVTSIGNSAFGGCRQLSHVVLPHGLGSLGQRLFYNCSSLESLIIPKSVKSIGVMAFEGCSSLTDVYYGGSQEEWNTVSVADDSAGVLSGVSIHYGQVCGEDLVWFIVNGQLTLAGAGETFDYGASDPAPWYGDRSEIKTVFLPHGVSVIGSYAFADLDALETVVFPSSVVKVGRMAFENCVSLANVSYSGGQDEWDAMEISEGNDALVSAPRYSASSGVCGDELTWTYYPEGAGLMIFGAGDMYEFKSASDAPWYKYRQDIVSVTVSDGATSLSDFAFNGYDALEDVSVPESLERLGASVFYGSSIKYNSFGNAKYLGNENSPYLILAAVDEGASSCQISQATKFISSSSFTDAVRLRSLTIPESVVSIGDSAFGNCPKLSSIYIPENVAHIGAAVFASCNSLTSVEVSPDNATYRSSGNCVIEKATGRLVAGCPASVIPEDGVVTISASAFFGLSKITGIDLPESLTEIGASAFYGCCALESITIPAGVTAIGSGAFTNCTSLKTVSLPDGLTDVESSLFSGCSALESVTVPKSVKSVGRSAFNGCTALKYVYYEGDEAEFEKISVDNSGGSNFPFVNATVYYNSGEDIPEIAWSLDGGVLTVITDGEMPVYPSPSDYPWASAAGDVSSVEIQYGATSIAPHAFSSLVNLASVRLPSGVTSVGEGAFEGCGALEKVYYGGFESARDGIAVGDGNENFESAKWMFATEEYYLDSSEIYSFANSKNNFGSAYNVSDADFTRLCDYVKLIYKDDPARASTVINMLQSYRTMSWKGSCYGMASSAILDKNGQIAFNENFGGVATLGEVEPASDNAAVESALNYYHIAQKIPYVRGGNRAVYNKGRQNWRGGLRELVMRAEEGVPMLFCYGFSGGAHAIVIKGYREGADGSHCVMAYDNRYPSKDTVISIDKNYNTCIVNRREDCSYVEFVSDMSCFDAIDIDGATNDYENFVMPDEHGGASSDKTAEITVSSKGRVVIVNAEGDTLVYDGGAVGGSMDISSVSLILEDSEAPDDFSFTYTVPDSDYFTFTPDDAELTASVLASGFFASSETDGAKKVKISKDDGVTAYGVTAAYTLSVSVNDGACDMISIFGESGDEVGLSPKKDGKVTASGVDTTGCTVNIYSATVNVDVYSLAHGYSAFVVRSLSDTPGDVEIVGSSQEDGVYDVKIGVPEGACEHVWSFASDAGEPTRERCGAEIWACEGCGLLRRDLLPRITGDVAGDANGDFLLNSKDVLVLRRLVAGLCELDEETLARCDVSSDGDVTAADILLIRKIIAGIY